VAALDADHAQRVGHLDDREVVDRGGGVLDGPAERSPIVS
jgi:hypothetical protein